MVSFEAARAGFNRDEGDTGDKNQINRDKRNKKDNRDRSTPWKSIFFMSVPIPFIPFIPVKSAFTFWHWTLIVGVTRDRRVTNHGFLFEI